MIGMRTLLFAIAVILPLSQAPPAAPRAESASIRGRITDRVSGEPIARAVVTASPADGRSRMTRTITDRDGRYVFAALSPGRYFIRADPPLFRARSVGAAVHANGVHSGDSHTHAGRRTHVDRHRAPTRLCDYRPRGRRRWRAGGASAHRRTPDRWWRPRRRQANGRSWPVPDLRAVARSLHGLCRVDWYAVDPGSIGGSAADPDLLPLRDSE